MLENRSWKKLPKLAKFKSQKTVNMHCHARYRTKTANASIHSATVQKPCNKS